MASLLAADVLQALAVGPRVHKNLPASLLIETAIKRGEAHLAANGALVATTGARTGRSPKDKYTVDDQITHDLVDWGRVNQPLASDKFDALLERGRGPQSQHFARRRQTRQGFENISKPRKISAGSVQFAQAALENLRQTVGHGS